MFRAFAIGLAIGVTILDVLGYVVKVEGISMQPVLNPDGRTSNDWVFLNRWHVNRRRFRSFCFQKGEIVSITSPRDPSQKIIGRIISLEGDIVGLKFFEDIVKLDNIKDIYFRIPQGHCWIEGDNFGHSLDSNKLGPISLSLITAKVSHIVWPPSRWSKLSTKIPLNLESVRIKSMLRNINIKE